MPEQTMTMTWTSECERYAQENDHTLASIKDNKEHIEMWCYHPDKWELKTLHVSELYQVRDGHRSEGFLNASNGK